MRVRSAPLFVAVAAALMLSIAAEGIPLGSKYAVQVENNCEAVEKGTLKLNFQEHTYVYATNAATTSGSFKFTCGGKMDVFGELETWGSGQVADDGSIVFGGQSSCAFTVRLTPAPKTAVWPFCE
jgi:hypothetical protein